MRRLLHVLNVLGFVLGAVIVLYGGVRYLTQQALAPLLIAAAVVIVGPLEELLKSWAGRQGASEAGRADRLLLVDRATSALFLALLLWAIAI